MDRWERFKEWTDSDNAALPALVMALCIGSFGLSVVPFTGAIVSFGLTYVLVGLHRESQAAKEAYARKLRLDA